MDSLKIAWVRNLELGSKILNVYITVFLLENGHPGARSSRLRQVRGMVRPLWVFSTEPFPTFPQEAGSRTRTRRLIVTRQSFAAAPMLPFKNCHLQKLPLINISFFSGKKIRRLNICTYGFIHLGALSSVLWLRLMWDVNCLLLVIAIGYRRNIC